MFACLMLVVLTLAADDKKGDGPSQDLAPLGSEWEGIYKATEISSTGKQKQVTMDLRIVIMDRKGEKFTGEYWGDNNKKGFAIEGTIDTKGNIAFKFTKKLKGSWPSDMIGNAQVQGTVKKNELVANFAKPGTQRIIGQMALKRKKAE